MNQLVSLAVFPLLSISPSHCFSATSSPTVEACLINIAGTRGIHIRRRQAMFCWQGGTCQSPRLYCSAVITRPWVWQAGPTLVGPLTQRQRCRWGDYECVGRLLRGSQEVTTGGCSLCCILKMINCNLTFGKWQKMPSRFWENICDGSQFSEAQPAQ